MLVGLGSKTLEGEPIQSKTLAKLIEQAQKAVESQNYRIRKDVLQFDDVVNTQRELIYKQRREVLLNENVHDAIIKMIESYVEDNIDPMDLMNSIEQNSVLNAVFESDQFSQGESDESVVDSFKKSAVAFYENKMSSLPDGVCTKLEDAILLKSVDSHWIEHIDAMNDLQKGISMRYLSQKDPVQEYKKEGLEMFNEMTHDIREVTVEQLMLIDWSAERAEA